MELYILSKQDLSILSICKLADYQINLDEETNAKSTFTLMKTNGLKKENYMVLNGLYRQFIFVIDDVQTEKESDVVTVTALDISNVFNRKVIEKNIDIMKSKSIEEFLANTISADFVNSDDTALNVNYIEIYWHTNTQGNVATNAENGLYNFHTFLTNCRQYKNIYTDFKLENLGNPQTVEGKRINVEAKNRKIVDIMLEGESQQATRSGKNLFDKDNANIINTYLLGSGNGVLPSDGGTKNNCIYIPCKTNTTYTIQKMIGKRFGVAYTYETPAQGVMAYNKTVDNNVASITITTDSSAKYLVVYLRNGNASGEITLQQALDSLQIEKGSTATDYEPYGVMPSPDYRSKIENIEGRNILQNKQKTQTINGVTFTVNKDKSVTLSGTATADTNYYFYTTSNYLTLKKGNYTLSGVKGGSTTLYRMLIYKTDWTFIGQDIGYGLTFTLEEDVNVFIYIWVQKGITVKTTVYPQLERGTVATPYVPYHSLELKVTNGLEETDENYQEQVATFPLGEEKLMEGSYLADDGIHHNFKEGLANGTSTTFEDAKENGKFYCNQKASGNLEGKTIAFDTEVTDAIVQYELAEEEIVPYTEEQQEAWNNIKNLTLFEGVNHISSDANMVLKYYPLEPVGLKFVLRIDIENKQETTELIDTTLPEVADYNKIYEEDVTAKVQVYIREDGSEYNLYLKTDRTTTTNKDDPDRASGKIEVISVETADKAPEEALNVMKGNNYKHLVEFKIAKTSKLMDITELHIGRPIKIKTDDDIYDSYISAITLSDENFVYFKSGSLRITLLDKLKQKFLQIT